MSAVTDLHDAVKRGDLAALGALLKANPALAHARSETDPRGTYPLHVAAEFGQAEAARLLLEHGADGFASRPGKRRHRLSSATSTASTVGSMKRNPAARQGAEIRSATMSA
jgi:ankyrin repeat protein